MVEELGKPPGEWCTHCLKSSGCAIYDQRPQQCQTFYCGWLSNDSFGDEWYPRRAKMVLFSAGSQLLFGAILGEYVGRILQEVSGRPAYVVRRRIGLTAPRRRSGRAKKSSVVSRQSSVASHQSSE